MSARSKFLNKKVAVIAILAVGVLSAVLVVSSITQARAQHMWKGQQVLPEINGTVNVGDQARDFFKGNAKISFVAAAETAQRQVINGTILGGHLNVVQGYLAYSFFAADLDKETGNLVIVDAGDGKVLYTSEEFEARGMPFGPAGMHFSDHGHPGFWGAKNHYWK